MADPRAGDMQMLRELNAGYIRAVVTSDVGWFEAHLSEDFLNSNPDGSLVDKAAFLRQIARPMTLAEFSYDDERIRILGDTAIIHARTTYRKPDGSRGTGRYTDIWAHHNGRWVCVAAHVTRG